MINQNTIKLADFGLSKRIKEASERDLDLFDTVPYVDPKKFVSNKSYLLNKKSDVYSIGVILWEISSGQPPFKDQLYDSSLVVQISKGYREAIVSDTPSNYSSLYIGKYYLIYSHLYYASSLKFFKSFFYVLFRMLEW